MPPGTTVTWTNRDQTAHTVTSDEGAWPSATLASGQSFSFTFTRRDSFGYFCSIYEFMQGLVNVGGGAGREPHPWPLAESNHRPQPRPESFAIPEGPVPHLRPRAHPRPQPPRRANG